MPRQQVETYLGNVNVKKDGVQQDWTEEEIVEYQKCFDDPIYFTQTYVKIVSLDEGLVPFSLYPYQNKMFKHFNDNRFSIVLECRQSGKSISVCESHIFNVFIILLINSVYIVISPVCSPAFSPLFK